MSTQSYFRLCMSFLFLYSFAMPAQAFPANPEMVKDISPGEASSIDYYGSKTVMINNIMFFFATDGIHGEELWKSDGTSSGTVMVKDINPEGSSIPDDLTASENTLFFFATDGVHGKELWRYRTDYPSVGLSWLPLLLGDNENN